MKLIIASITALLFCSKLLATDSEVGLWYTGANPDYKPFESEYGFAFTISSQYDSGLFSKLLHNDTDFRASGPEVGGVQIQSWTEVGMGYTFPEQWGNFYSYLSYSSIDSALTSYSGLGIHLGYEKHWSKSWRGLIQFGYIDTDFHDFQLEGQLFYQLNDDFSVNLGLRDYHDWDYTSYEAGITYYF